MDKNVSRKAAQLVAQHGNTLDMGRQLSMGPGGAKTLLDEGEKARPTSITITNHGTADRAIVFGVPRHTIYTSVTGTPDTAAFLEAVGADLVLTDGILETGAGDVTVVEATSNDSGRTI
ncbi:hypothetical protein, partial [Lishizhenia sp.]|uniref:hypothetical protein n=1 Tax=Lishizhenia sp. TaxID=2497594 RepID=UPI00299DF027